MNKWIWKTANNGWVDWTCPECGWYYNDDIHVTLCGEGLIDDGEDD